MIEPLNIPVWQWVFNFLSFIYYPNYLQTDRVEPGPVTNLPSVCYSGDTYLCVTGNCVPIIPISIVPLLPWPLPIYSFHYSQLDERLGRTPDRRLWTPNPLEYRTIIRVFTLGTFLDRPVVLLLLLLLLIILFYWCLGLEKFGWTLLLILFVYHALCQQADCCVCYYSVPILVNCASIVLCSVADIVLLVPAQTLPQLSTCFPPMLTGLKTDRTGWKTWKTAFVLPHCVCVHFYNSNSVGVLFLCHPALMSNLLFLCVLLYYSPVCRCVLFYYRPCRFCLFPFLGYTLLFLGKGRKAWVPFVCVFFSQTGPGSYSACALLCVPVPLCRSIVEWTIQAFQTGLYYY